LYAQWIYETNKKKLAMFQEFGHGQVLLHTQVFSSFGRAPNKSMKLFTTSYAELQHAETQADPLWWPKATVETAG